MTVPKTVALPLGYVPTDFNITKCLFSLKRLYKYESKFKRNNIIEKDNFMIIISFKGTYHGDNLTILFLQDKGYFYTF